MTKRIFKKLQMTPEQRFWSKVDRNGVNGCWLWKTGKDKDGYGKFNPTKLQHIRAHRFSFWLVNGIIPKGMFVCHSCDNPSCVNPKHLFLGSPKDNTRDMIRKGRANRLRGEDCSWSKLSDESIKMIRGLYKRSDLTQYALAKKFNISQAQISNIVTGKRWSQII